jgi:arsenite oxidase small subunit
MNEKPVARRDFLRVGGAATVGGLTVTSVSSMTVAAGSKTRVAALSEIRPWQPLSFEYPADEPAMLLDTGRAVDGGIGPGKSIVAFNTLCQHMGCPLDFEETSRRLVCGCHASLFDPARGGMAIEGPATRGLPRVALIIESGSVYAVGISDGLVYGYACHA